MSVKQTLIGVMSLLLFWNLGAALPAQTGENSSVTPSPDVQSERRIIYREKSYFEFEDTLVRGNRRGPDGSSVFRKDRVKFRSQLNLDRSFMPELKSSAQDLQ